MSSTDTESLTESSSAELNDTLANTPEASAGVPEVKPEEPPKTQLSAEHLLVWLCVIALVAYIALLGGDFIYFRTAIPKTYNVTAHVESKTYNYKYKKEFLYMTMYLIFAGPVVAMLALSTVRVVLLMVVARAIPAGKSRNTASSFVNDVVHVLSLLVIGFGLYLHSDTGCPLISVGIAMAVRLLSDRIPLPLRLLELTILLSWYIIPGIFFVVFHQNPNIIPSTGQLLEDYLLKTGCTDVKNNECVRFFNQFVFDLKRVYVTDIPTFTSAVLRLDWRGYFVMVSPTLLDPANFKMFKAVLYQNMALFGAGHLSNKIFISCGLSLVLVLVLVLVMRRYTEISLKIYTNLGFITLICVQIFQIVLNVFNQRGIHEADRVVCAAHAAEIKEQFVYNLMESIGRDEIRWSKPGEGRLPTRFAYTALHPLMRVPSVWRRLEYVSQSARDEDERRRTFAK